MLAVSVLTVVLAFVMETRPDGRVAFAGLSRFPLPELCGSRLVFDSTCPGCGLTRSIIALAEGDWAASLRYHRIGWLLAFAILLQIPYRLFALRELRAGIPERSWPNWFGILLIAALLINWLGNLAPLAGCYVPCARYGVSCHDGVGSTPASDGWGLREYLFLDREPGKGGAGLHGGGLEGRGEVFP